MTSGIITNGTRSEDIGSHPIVKAIKELECAMTKDQSTASLEKLYGLCQEEGSEAPGLAGRYGGVEVTITSVTFLNYCIHGITVGLKTLKILLKGQFHGTIFVYGHAETRDYLIFNNSL